MSLRIDIIEQTAVVAISKSNEKPRTLVWFFLTTILMFMYIFQFDLSAFGILEQITSTRISVLIFYIIGIFEIGIIPGRNVKNGLGKLFIKITWLNVFLFFYMLFIFVAIGVKEGTHMVTIIINFFLLQIIPCVIFFKYYRSIDELLEIIMYAVGLQTVIIWICLTVPSLSFTIDAMFNQVDNYTLAREGYAGGLGCIAAPGYIRYFLGQLACFYFIAKNQNKIPYLILYLLFSLTGSMIARTGLIGSIIGAIVIVIYLISVKGNRNLIACILATTIVVFIALNWANSSNEASSFFEKRFFRLSSLIEESKSASSIGEIHFFDIYFHDEGTIIPELNNKTYLGTGVPSGTSGNDVKVNVDGEYIRLYVAFGLPLAIFFYLFIYINLFLTTIKQKDKIVKYTLYFFILFSFAAVFKEWTFYATPYLTLFILIASLPTRGWHRKKLLTLTNTK